MRIVALETKVKNLEPLEQRVQDLELFTRKEDVIISGMEIKPWSYAVAARREGEELPMKEQESVETQVVHFLRSKNIHLDKNNLTACHTRKDRNAKPTIIIRFVNRKQKTELLMQGRKLQGTDIYLNEHLTHKNAKIAREARKLRNDDKIKSTWTSKVMMRLKTERVMMVRELEDLDEYR